MVSYPGVRNGLLCLLMMGVAACLLYLSYRAHAQLAQPEPRPAVAGLPVGRSMMPETPASVAEKAGESEEQAGV